MLFHGIARNYRVARVPSPSPSGVPRFAAKQERRRLLALALRIA
jgi:hypothetical protein